MASSLSPFEVPAGHSIKRGLAAHPFWPTKCCMVGEATTDVDPLAAGYRSLDEDTGAAVAYARVALGSKPESPPALRLLGLALRQSGQPGEAAEFEQRALKAATADPTLLRAGHALVANQLHEAEPLLRERLKRDP